MLNDLDLAKAEAIGNEVDEYFRTKDGKAYWKDTTGTGEARIENDALFYIDQNKKTAEFGG